MESRDDTLQETSPCDTKPIFASASARLAALSAASPSCLGPHDLISSEGPDDCARIHPSSSRSDARSDQLLQGPFCSTGGDSLKFPPSSQQLHGDAPAAEGSAECLWQEFPSSRELSSQSVSSSEQPMDGSLAYERGVEQVHHSLQNPSQLHPRKEVSPLKTAVEGLTQDLSSEAGSCGSSSSDVDSQAEELGPSTSANENLDAIPLEQPPVTVSASTMFDTSSEECFSEEEEVPDDLKQEMLKEKHKGVAILSCNYETRGSPSYVYLIGTAHVSEESCREVQAVISLMKPEVVFVELCQKRAFILRRRHIVVPTVSNLLASWKESRTNLLGILYSWFLGKVAAELHVLPGSEFRAAYEEAQVCGAKVILGDRDIEVTLRRTWGKMSVWHRVKFIALIVYNIVCLPKADQLNELIEKLKDSDMITVAFEELGNTFPTLLETLIDERDMFMAAVLQKLGEDSSSIVAVVGRGHIAGITKYWGQDICTQTLLETPAARPLWTRTFTLCIVSAMIAFISIILYVYYRQGS